MDKLKFIDGTPVPDAYLTSASLLVRDASVAINMFGEDELEAAARSGTPQEAEDLVMTSIGLVSAVQRSPEIHAIFKEGHLLGDVRSKFGSWYACPPSNEPVTFLYEPQQTMQAAIERLLSLTWKWRA